MAKDFLVGVDIGGTFTDCVVIADDGRLEVGKVATTPADRSIGFFGSIEHAASKFGFDLAMLLERTRRLVHGTTAGTNALISRTGAQVGLIGTVGQSDVLTIMKGGGRTAGLPAELLSDLVEGNMKPLPLVREDLIVEVTERVDRNGEILVPLDEESVRTAVATLIERGVESIAVSLLWSIKNPVHENRVRAIVEEMAPHIFLTCGSELVSAVGEYERTTTCVMNAYIGPLMLRYVDNIESRARQLGYTGEVLFAHCAGGAITAREVCHRPIMTVQSGPVAGIINTALFGKAVNEPHLLTADMGGTTFDVSVIRNFEPLKRNFTSFQRFEMALPMLDVESVGAGGGSIAWIDSAGRLEVGPRSAGSVPGPVCYGHGGTEPTVTDADVVLGIIDPDDFLHGTQRLDRDAATAAIQRLADQLGLDVHATAAGISDIVDAKMADLLRRMTEFRGLDPRNFAMLAFGGGGPVHAAACAAAARVRRVIVPLPQIAPVWSAGGAANADLTYHYSRAISILLPAPPAAIEDVLAELEAQARARLGQEGFSPHFVEITRRVRMRHRAQVYDVDVPLNFPLRTDADVQRLMAEFASAYEERFGPNSGYAASGVLVTAIELNITGVTPKGAFALPVSTIDKKARGSRPIYWREARDFVDTPVLRMTGADRVEGKLRGPYIVQFPDTVAVVRPGHEAWFDGLGNLIIDTAPEARPNAGEDGSESQNDRTLKV